MCIVKKSAGEAANTVEAEEEIFVWFCDTKRIEPHGRAHYSTKGSE